MADTFNPYHRWLSLPEGQTTPTYYELLGLPRGEQKTDKIAQAADRAMTKVRSFRPGPQAALWAKLLDEIQLAKATLLDPQLRAQYDAGQGAAPNSSAPLPATASAPLNPSAPRPPANPALYPPGMAPPGTSSHAQTESANRAGEFVSASGPAASPLSSKLYPPGFAPAVMHEAALNPAPIADTGTPYATPLGTPGSVPEQPQQGYIPSAVPLNMPLDSTIPTYAAASYPQAIPVGGASGQPQYGQYPQYAQEPYMAAGPGLPHSALPPGMAMPSAAPQPQYMDARGGVPVPQAYPAAAPYSAGGAYDPMAPVALPVSAHSGANLPQPVPLARYAPAVPMATPVHVAAGGESPFATGYAPIGGAAAAVPLGQAPTAAPIAASATAGPQIRASNAAVAAVAARRDRQQQSSALVIGGVVGGLILLAGALAYVAINFSDNEPEVARNNDSTSNPQPAPPTTPTPRPITKPAPTVVPAPSPAPTPKVEERLRPQPDVPSTPQPIPAAPMPTPSPPPSVPAPMPLPPMTPTTPMPAPVPPPMPPPEVKPTREDLIALGKAMTTAKDALSEQNFSVADRSLEDAEKLAKLPEHRAKVGRLKTLGSYVRQFRKAVEEATNKLEAGESFMVGSSTVVSFVEGGPDRIIIRSSGQNRTYLFHELPLGLAVAIADLKLDGSDPVSRIVKGAYVAVDKRSDADALDKAKTWWEEARLGGADLGDLQLVLTDRYDFEKDAESK